MPRPPLKLLLWLTLGLAAAATLVFAVWPRQEKVYVYKPSARARALSSIPQVQYKEKWVCHSSSFHSDYMTGYRWGYAGKDGSLACIDNDNWYFVAVGGKSQLPANESTPIPAFVLSFFPSGRGGYYVSNERNLAELDRLGHTCWARQLPDLPPYVTLANRWTLTAPISGGDLLELDNWTLRRLSADGQQLAYAELAQEMQQPASLAVRPDGVLLVYTDIGKEKRQPVLQALSQTGHLLWQVEPGFGDRIRMVALPDNSVILGNNRSGLQRFAASGQRLWTIRLRRGFDGNSFAVTPGGRIIAWLETQLCYFDLDGKPVAKSLELGSGTRGYDLNNLDFIAGSDGNYCIQIIPVSDMGKPLGSNEMLVLSPEGEPLSRVDLGQDEFDLVAAGSQGELYGLRLGANLESDGWTSTNKCDVVCLEPAAP